jgi:Transglycosylase SLT domain
MRPIIALGIFLLGLNGAAPEPEYSSLNAESFHFAKGTPVPSLVAIESSMGKGDREIVSTLRPTLSIRENRVLASLETPLSDSGITDDDANTAPAVSVDDLCQALLTSAQDNDLPVPFFANLLWQESGLRDDVISSKGAMGIAQFMPEVAAEKGLNDPFDPLQAIPASARLLRELRLQFGNLGFVAAAYNAGAHRVSQWLEHRRKLPRETRGYVANITGRSVDQWRTTPPDDEALKFVRRLPCRDLPAFADLEQQLQQAQAERAQLEPAQAAHTSSQRARAWQKLAHAKHRSHQRAAERKGPHPQARHEAARTAAHNDRGSKHQAEHNQRPPREKRKAA